MELIWSAPRANRADANERGVKFDFKPTLTSHQQKDALASLEAGETQRSMARSYKGNRSTVSRLADTHSSGKTDNTTATGL